MKNTEKLEKETTLPFFFFFACKNLSFWSLEKKELQPLRALLVMRRRTYAKLTTFSLTVNIYQARVNYIIPMSKNIFVWLFCKRKWKKNLLYKHEMHLLFMSWKIFHVMCLTNSGSLYCFSLLSQFLLSILKCY